MFDTANANIKQGQNGKIVMSKLNRTFTLNKSLRVADVSEVINKSLEENTLMR